MIDERPEQSCLANLDETGMQSISNLRQRAQSEDVLINEMFQYQKRLQQKFSEDIDKLDSFKKNKSCRICFIGDEDLTEEERKKKERSINDKNPLISPCSCTGSTKYIHLDCLRLWLKSKMIVINRYHCDNYIYKVAACELC